MNVIRGKVALTNLAANQVVVDGQFVDPKVATVSSAQRIPTGNVAITIQVDQVRGVANLIQPGDKVNMLVSVHRAWRSTSTRTCRALRGLAGRTATR